LLANLGEAVRCVQVHAKGLGEVTTYTMDVPYEHAARLKAESVRKKLELMDTNLKSTV
jgi:ATP-dependent Clp protease adapter protein ClpS